MPAGLRTDGRVECWGILNPYWESPGNYFYTRPGCLSYPRNMVFKQLSASPVHVCGLNSTGGVVCWSVLRLLRFSFMQLKTLLLLCRGCQGTGHNYGQVANMMQSKFADVHVISAMQPYLPSTSRR